MNVMLTRAQVDTLKANLTSRQAFVFTNHLRGTPLGIIAKESKLDEAAVTAELCAALAIVQSVCPEAVAVMSAPISMPVVPEGKDTLRDVVKALEATDPHSVCQQQ